MIRVYKLSDEWVTQWGHMSSSWESHNRRSDLLNTVPSPLLWQLTRHLCDLLLQWQELPSASQYRALQHGWDPHSDRKCPWNPCHEAASSLLTHMSLAPRFFLISLSQICFLIDFLLNCLHFSLHHWNGLLIDVSFPSQLPHPFLLYILFC